MTPKLPVGAYVRPFVKITAKDIENWVDGNVGARSLLPVLLRKLGNSRGQDLTLVDFPGYDQAEKKGWDVWLGIRLQGKPEAKSRRRLCGACEGDSTK
jgi:hypothetical protein